MPAEPPNYYAYLLRLWRDGELAPWRASLEAPGHPEVLTFRDIKALIAFLLEKTTPTEPVDRSDTDTRTP
jgi:hypothetical protein